MHAQQASMDAQQNARFEGQAEAVPAEDLKLDQAWTVERLGDENPQNMCDVTLYMLHTVVGQNDGSLNFSTPCQCQGCAGGGPGTECCCQRPQSLKWSCEYLIFRSRIWEQAKPMDPIKQSLPWLLTCPLCPKRSGASTTYACCTTAKSHVEAFQEKIAMPRNPDDGLADVLFKQTASIWCFVALGIASLFAVSWVYRRRIAESHLQSKHDLVAEEGGSLLHT